MSTTHTTTPIQRFAVTGMTCEGCVRSVTRVLARVPGAADVQVSLTDATAQVAGTATPSALIAAIRKAGYGAELLAS